MYKMIEFHNRNQRRTRTSHTVEETYHFRHRRHLHSLCSECSYYAPHRNAAEYPTIIAKAFAILLIKKNCSKNGNGHACCSKEIPLPGSCRI
jgi:hypothetical protein